MVHSDKGSIINQNAWGRWSRPCVRSITLMLDVTVLTICYLPFQNVPRNHLDNNRVLRGFNLLNHWLKIYVAGSLILYSYHACAHFRPRLAVNLYLMQMLIFGPVKMAIICLTSFIIWWSYNIYYRTDNFLPLKLECFYVHWRK